MSDHKIPEYGWQSSEATCAHAYLLPGIEKGLARWRGRYGIGPDERLRLFDAGCGNGFLARAMAERGYEVAGCDYSAKGIAHARSLLPESRFEQMSVYDDMAAVFGGGWDIVLSSEVVEHLYDPAKLVQNVLPLLRPGGLFLISTPYHGYLKNLVLGLAGKWDNHFTVLWDGGHIKFWSRRTLATLLEDNGFLVREFYGAGRFPWLWKSMILAAEGKAIRN